MRNLRQQIDEIDAQILELLKKRTGFALQIADQKKAMELPIKDERREMVIMNKLKAKAEELGLSPKFVSTLYAVILDESRHLQS